MVCGENFPNILAGPENTRFREIYRRTLRYLLDGAKPGNRENVVSAGQRDSTTIAWDHPVTIDTVRYALPAFIDFNDPQWHRKPAPYAHYVIEGSLDAAHWVRLADRRHGPWRGVKTGTFVSLKVRYLRFDGAFSNGEPFRIRDVEALPAP